jgi:capsular polysaccharide biosynthesis protein
VKGRRALLLVVPVAVAAAAAGIYCAVATPRYEARAYVLVSPVARDDPAFAGIPVVRASDDPQAAARTIARLVPTEEVAEAVRLQLGSELSRSALLAAVSAHARDDTVAIEGSASSAPRAAQIANAFATELVAQRTARFQADRAAAVGQLRRQLASGARSGPERKAIARRLAVLDGLAGSSDPTVRVASAAAAPAHASWPRPWLLVPVALAAGAAIGLALLVVARRRRPSAPQYAAEHSGELAAAPPAPDTTGEWKIDDLERLVDEHWAAGADRVAEWEAYVFHLRQYADAEGGFRPSSTLSSRRRSATSSLPTSR